MEFHLHSSDGKIQNSEALHDYSGACHFGALRDRSEENTGS